jgi:repressor of nif and glnA expression
MRELSTNEILTIAGGLPPAAALDETFYRAPAEPLRDPVDFRELCADEPTALASD